MVDMLLLAVLADGLLQGIEGRGVGDRLTVQEALALQGKVRGVYSHLPLYPSLTDRGIDVSSSTQHTSNAYKVGFPDTCNCYNIVRFVNFSHVDSGTKNV